jgi:hypothetical protein
MNLAVGGVYWLVSGVMSAGWGMMKVQSETETISFIIRTSLFHQVCFQSLRLLSALLGLVIHVIILMLCWCESFVSIALRSILHCVLRHKCLKQNPNYVSTGLQQRKASCSHLSARLSKRVIQNIETQEVIFLLHIRETRVHSLSQTLAVCTQDFVASRSLSR